MIVEDIVEYVEVGDNRVKCLRLTKYNPDFVPRPKISAEADDAPVLQDIDELGRDLYPTLQSLIDHQSYNTPPHWSSREVSHLFKAYRIR